MRLLFEKSAKHCSYSYELRIIYYFILEKKLAKSKFKAETNKVVQKRGKNPKKMNSSKASETNQTIPKFINMLERPKVRKCKGRVTIFKTGLMKKLINPKIIPKETRICQSAVILKPKISDTPEITPI